MLQQRRKGDSRKHACDCSARFFLGVPLFVHERVPIKLPVDRPGGPSSRELEGERKKKRETNQRY